MPAITLPLHPHLYATLGQDVVTYYETREECAATARGQVVNSPLIRLVFGPQPADASRIGKAIALAQEGLLAGVLPFTLAATAIIGATAVGIASGILLAAPVLPVALILSGGSLAMLQASWQRSQTIRAVLEEIRKDYKASGIEQVRRRVQACQSARTALPVQTTQVLGLPRPPAGLEKPSLSPAECQLAAKLTALVAERAQLHLGKHPALSPAQALGKALRREEKRLDLLGWAFTARAQFNVLCGRVTPDTPALRRALLPLVRDYLTASSCQKPRNSYTFTQASLALRERLIR